MKKIIISAFAMSLSLLAFAPASVARETTVMTGTTQEKVAVKPEDLPEAVKTTLASDTYSGWQVTTAFLVTKGDNSQFFEISLKKGEETSTVNLDRDGKKIE